MSRNLSSDNGLGKMHLGSESGIAGALPFMTNGFNLRFISCVAFASQYLPTGYESTTCFAYKFLAFSLGMMPSGFRIYVAFAPQFVSNG